MTSSTTNARNVGDARRRRVGAEPVVYLDTSAAVKLISEERGSDTLRAYLDNGPTVSSDLLETQLRRIGVHNHIDQVLITAVLDGMSLIPLTREQFRDAGLFPQVGLRSLDALHLAGALGIEASAMLTYDIKLAEAARARTGGRRAAVVQFCYRRQLGTLALSRCPHQRRRDSILSARG